MEGGQRSHPRLLGVILFELGTPLKMECHSTIFKNVSDDGGGGQRTHPGLLRVILPPQKVEDRSPLLLLSGEPHGWQGVRLPSEAGTAF